MYSDPISLRDNEIDLMSKIMFTTSVENERNLSSDVPLIFASPLQQQMHCQMLTYLNTPSTDM